MSSRVLLGSFLLALLCAARALPSSAQSAQVEAAAPEIDATKWFELEGPPPTLAALRGRAVLLEFWATW